MISLWKTSSLGALVPLWHRPTAVRHMDGSFFHYIHVRRFALCTEKGISTARFRLGQVVATPGALEALEESSEGPAKFLARHQAGDWGDLCDEDRRSNDQAIAHEGDPERQERVLSAYTTARGRKLWVITEWDRSATTILLPEEY